jgi:hypothetical protein
MMNRKGFGRSQSWPNYELGNFLNLCVESTVLYLWYTTFNVKIFRDNSTGELWPPMAII